MTISTDFNGVIKAQDVEEANAVAQELGLGPVFSVLLSVDGNAPATHYGFHAWSKPDFIESVRTARRDKQLARIATRKQLRARTETKRAREQAIFDNSFQFAEGPFADFIASIDLQIVLTDFAVQPEPEPEPAPERFRNLRNG